MAHPTWYQEELRLRMRETGNRRDKPLPYPNSIEELRNRDYRRIKTGSCKCCMAEVQWWESPAGLYIPWEVRSDQSVTLHLLMCPSRKESYMQRLEDYNDELIWIPETWSLSRR